MTAQKTNSRLQQCIGALLCAHTLAGCAVGPDFVEPENDFYKMSLVAREDHASLAATSDAAVSCQWWLMFNDATLAELQLRSQTDNPDLQMASERIEQSRALLGIASSQLLPGVDAGASYSREALSENGKFAALGAPSRASDFWQLGFDASWEMDLWGRARRAREGAAAALEATAYDREAFRVTLSAEMARTYLQLRGTQAQLHMCLSINGRSLNSPPQHRAGQANSYGADEDHWPKTSQDVRCGHTANFEHEILSSLALIV